MVPPSALMAEFMTTYDFSLSACVRQLQTRRGWSVTDDCRPNRQFILVVPSVSESGTASRRPIALFSAARRCSKDYRKRCRPILYSITSPKSKQICIKHWCEVGHKARQNPKEIGTTVYSIHLVSQIPDQTNKK